MTAPHPQPKTVKTAGYEGDALDPASSVFVSANAGAGKTQRLSDRVLSLLSHGAAPSKILCLTFTKAAAAEMSQRILAELGTWVMAGDDAISEKLKKLLSRAPDKATLARARSLFATVLESPEGIRIETVHGFCQSLLMRFPVEADVSPHFTVMESRTAQEMLWESRLMLFDKARHHPPLMAAVRDLACGASASGLQRLFDDIADQKNDFEQLFQRPGGLDAAIGELWDCLKMSPDVSVSALIKKHFVYDAVTEKSLKRIADILLTQEKPTDRKTGKGLADWFICTDKDSVAVKEYIELFLTKQYIKRAQSGLFTKKGLTDAALIEQLLQEQERVAAFHEERQSLLLARLSEAAMRVAQAFLQIYKERKAVHARMDYDDLILAARDLLSRPGISPWVLYKLDGGIDHVLVDEAQDTSPEQWEIVKALTQDFFAGESKGAADRSLFIVGDEKQSIFGFQGADPKKLAEMHSYFKQRIENAKHTVVELQLKHSRRSVPQVLEAVDAVFATPLAHTAHRANDNGLVEIWPLVEGDEEKNITPETELARVIADTVHGWLNGGLWLEGEGRAVRAGDIMILLRKRGTMADRLVRALKRKNVPVAGIDRMVLGDNLAVQDLIALGQFLLLPEDDLTLAALLKSPIGDIGEDILFALAYDRGDKSLWQRLADNQSCAEIYQLLHGLRAKADYLPPYELYAHALDTLGLRKKIVGRMGGEYADSIDEFLSQSLLYQRENVPSLQGFLHWLTHSKSEIKRDMEQSGDAVRVLTVHGAKGLEAPVVIMPDTVTAPTLRETLLWHEGVPLWLPSSGDGNALYKRLRDGLKQDMLDEYRRLLYVAMTRARDRLYICGATAKEKPQEQSWYSLVENALKPLTEICDTPTGDGFRLGMLSSNPLPDSLPLKGEGSDGKAIADEGCDFIFKVLPPEKSPPAPLTPSVFGISPSAASPLDKNTYARGLLIHTLLQHLPEVETQNRMALAARLSTSFRDMLEGEREACAREAIALMENPAFAAVFSAASLAEVPVTGTVRVSGREVTISGQIDRLCISDNEIWVVDYKTNRTPPVQGEDVPAAYLRQMALYRLLLKEIYPEKSVRCALLWTAVPRMDILDESLLEDLDIK